MTNVRKKEGNLACADLGLDRTTVGEPGSGKGQWEGKAEEGAAAMPTPRLSGIQLKMKEGLVIY
jgi:hypothetical protein